MKKFPKIGQFRDVVREVRLRASYVGKDDAGNPIYEEPASYPVLTFVGSVKLHGTNAGISMQNGELVAQSRNNILTLDKDNFDFAFWVKQHEEELKPYFNEGMTIFGEWAGPGIQSGVAISEIPERTWFTFAIDDEPEGIYIPGLVYSIYDFATWEFKIDFNYPRTIEQELTKITEEVEAECPVAKHFGISGIGEGVVWSCGGLRFKVKGEKHSVSKVKKLVSADPEELNSIKDFVDYAVTPSRVKQAIQEVNAIDRTATGEVIRWVANDIIAEESDVLAKNNLPWKKVAGQVANKTKSIFFTLIDEL